MQGPFNLNWAGGNESSSLVSEIGKKLISNSLVSKISLFAITFHVYPRPSLKECGITTYLLAEKTIIDNYN